MEQLNLIEANIYVILVSLMKLESAKDSYNT